MTLGAFAGMKTDFDSLKRNLGKVKSDMSNTVAEDRDEDLWPDLQTVSTTWLHVRPPRRSISYGARAYLTN